MKIIKLCKFLVIISLCLFACKTRKVDIYKADITDQSAHTTVSKQKISDIDTSKTTITSKTTKLVNNTFEIDVIPDTGKIKVVNGNYFGKAHHVIIKGNMASQAIINELIQQNKSQITQATLNDSISTQNNIQKQIKTKATAMESNFTGIYWIIGVVLSLAGFVFMIRKYLI